MNSTHKAILDAMQGLEEMGGVHNSAEYVGIMDALIVECATRRMTCLKAEHSPAAMLKANGWHIRDTGGGCTAWAMDTPDGGFVYLTAYDDPSHEFDYGDKVTFGLYDKDGEGLAYINAGMFAKG